MSVAHCLKIASLLLLMTSVKCQRLDTRIQPEHYDLILLPIIAGDRPQLCGHVAIDFKVKGSSNLLTFHTADLKLISVVVELANVTQSRASRLTAVEDLCFLGLSESNTDTIQFIHTDQSGQQASVITKQVLHPGVDYRISILYTGRVRDNETLAFFRGTYNDPHSCCQRWFGATQMEVAHARKVLPCLDEPSFKATFQVTLGHESKMKALSNMPDVSSVLMSGAGGWAWTEFDTTPPMSTYLLAFVITDFEQSTIAYKSDNRTVLLRFWARPGQLQLVRHLMDAAPQMMHFLETYLEQPFTLPKVDFYAPPISVKNFLAMENWGLIVFTEERYYFDEKKDSRMKGFELMQVMAHELAHQFFGNLVTSDWWSDIWLNEAFAGFFEFAIAEQILPSYRGESDRNRAEGAINAHRMEESDPKGHPVVNPVNSPEEAEQNFSILSYSKGNVLLRMLQYFMGHENFRKGLAAYFDKYKFKNANSTQLWEVMNKQMQRDRRVGNRINIREIMETWTYQASFPIIKCYRTPNGRVKLSQQKFPGRWKNVQLKPWWVPVNIVNGRNADFSPKGMSARLWLTPQRTELEVAVTVDKSISPLDNDTWVLVNGDFTAYTRVDYDELNWRLLSRQLMSNYSRISMLSRIKLIDDAFTLGVNGLIGFDIPLWTIEYLATEHDEHVLPTALRHLRDIKAAVTDNSTLVSILQDFIDKVSKVTPKNNELARSGDGDDNKFTRFYCESRDETCIHEAIHLFNSVVDRSATEQEERFAQDEFDWIGCVAIENGGDKEWRFAWKQSLNPGWKQWHDKIYTAMACSPSEKRIKQFLARAFQSTLHQKPEITGAIVRNLAQSASRPLVFTFLMDNWSLLETHLRPLGGPMELLESITSQSSSSKELGKINSFFKGRDLKGKEASKAESILDKIRKNIEFLESRSGDLYSALSQFNRRKERNA